MRMILSNAEDSILKEVKYYRSIGEPTDYFTSFHPQKKKMREFGIGIFPMPRYEKNKYISGEILVFADEYLRCSREIKLEKSEEIIPEKESTGAIKKTMKQDFALSMSEMAIGLALMITGAVLAYIPLAIIGFGSAGLGFLHLAWTTKPKK